MSDSELAKLPEIGAVVRSKIPFGRSRTGSSGRVKAVLSDDCGQTIVVEAVGGGEFTLSRWEYSCFFEECDLEDAAWDYWAGYVNAPPPI